MKLIPYGHQLLDRCDKDGVMKVLDSDWLTQGPMVKKFEDGLCRYTKAKYAVAVSSGTAALHAACLAAGINSGDEVITSALTFAASANCALYCLARPVFADIAAQTGNIDPQDAESKINRNTRAIIPVHFAGSPCDMKEIAAIAGRNELTVIEDAAHALGADYLGDKVGSCRHSDMTIFSFHPVKSITTAEGGAILTNQRKFYDILVRIRNHGISRNGFSFDSHGDWYYEMQSLGYNYRITDIQASLGCSQLKKLDRFITLRRNIAGIYRRAFRDNPYFDLPQENGRSLSSYHLFNIRLRDPYAQNKKHIFSILRKRGLGVQVHYIPVYLHPYYRKIGYRPGLCPRTEEYYRRELSIPLYPGMKKKEANLVISIILDTFDKIGPAR